MSLECLCDECEKRPPTPIKKRKKKFIGQNQISEQLNDVEEKENTIVHNTTEKILNSKENPLKQPEIKEKKTFECDLCCKHYEANSFGVNEENIKKKKHLVCDNCYPHLNVKKKIIKTQNEEENKYCICRKDESVGDMAQCEKCENWLHLKCLGLKKKDISNVEHFSCDRCKFKV
jgi:hypothetical protein